MQQKTIQLIERYYDAFNQKDMDTFFSLLDDNIIHDINQDNRYVGKEEFKKFMALMHHCYQEQFAIIEIMVNADGSHAAAEFMMDGIYLATEPGFPEAKKQLYSLPAGTFFTIAGEKITRITTYYNVNEWLQLIS